MTTLTKDMKEIILQAFLDEKIGPVALELAANERVLADEVRLAHLGDWANKVEKAPRGLFLEDNDIQVMNAQNRMERLRFYKPDVPHYRLARGGYYSSDGYDRLRVVANMGMFPNAVSDDLRKRIHNHLARVDEIQEKSNQVQRQLETAINQFRTVKKLKAEWPEAFEKLPERVKAGEQVTAIMIPVENIMAALNEFPDGEMRA
jgi:hypothetical protein